jgi:acyl-CoA thioester hydrolase
MDAPTVTHQTTIRVRYADTDQMQIVYNGKYLEYFEVGRTELLRSLGLAYAEMERQGTRLPLIEAHVTYKAPARYDDLLIIESSVHDYHSPRLRLDYRVLRSSSQEVLTTGYTVHAFQDVSSGRIIRPPRVFLETLGGNPPA